MAAKRKVRAVGYARRSTDVQERSIPDQKAYVQRWAEEHGYTIRRWFTDDAVSGTSTKGREAFERLIHDAENSCDFDAVLCYDISRFSRGGTNEIGYYLYRLEQAGVRVIFCAEALPDAQGRHVRFIAGSEGVGKVKSDVVRYVPGDPQHVKTVQRIFEMCCQGYGFRCTAIALNDDGIPSPTGGRWNHRQVKLMLTNPVYRGALCYNKTSQAKIHGIAADGRPCTKKGKGTERNSRDRWLVVEDVHEPLVSKEVFEKARAEMACRRDAKGEARPTHRYLLSGLLKCTHCGLNFWGAALTLYPKNTRRRYYVDAGYRKYGPKVCKSTSIQTEPLDAWVLDKVREVILADAEGTQAAVDAFVKAVMAKQKRGADTSAIEKELAAVNKRIKTTVVMLADHDLADMDELKVALVDLKRQRELLEARKEKAAGAKGELVGETALRKWAMEKLNRLGEALDGNLSPLETRRLVHSYVSHIDIDPYACTGTMFMVPDALAALEAESIRRVNVSSGT